MWNWCGFNTWIWNKLRFIFKWKLWRLNLNITIINVMMIKSPHDIWNQRTFFGRRGPVFEVRWWRLAVKLSWWISWFTTIKGIKLVHISSKTWREEVRAVDNSGIILLSNSSTAFINNLLSNAESFNNCMESFCINFLDRWGTKMMRALNWSGQCSWVSKNV